MTQRATAAVDLLHAPVQLSALEKCLLNEYQRGFPLCDSPYAEIGRQLGVSETEVIDTLRSLQQRGLISRVGPVFKPNRAGASTLAAMAVPEARLDAVAALVSACDEVNHNYERDHTLNLWFVVTAADRDRVTQVLKEIERRSGLEVLDLPLEEPFRLDLGFEIRWPDA